VAAATQIGDNRLDLERHAAVRHGQPVTVVL